MSSVEDYGPQVWTARESGVNDLTRRCPSWAALPAGAKYSFTVQGIDAGTDSYNTASVRVTEANATGKTIVGAEANATGKTLTGPYQATAYCFDAAGALLEQQGAFASPDVAAPDAGVVLDRPVRRDLPDVPGRVSAYFARGSTSLPRPVELMCARVCPGGTVDVMDANKVSKLLSRVLRHSPGDVGITLDAAGWVPVRTLLTALADSGRRVSRTELEQVVATSDKQRFELSAAGDRIRARQGHSVPVDLGLTPQAPPAAPVHGTPRRNVAAIMAGGLTRQRRHAVHLSPDAETARRVGARRGEHVVFTIDAAAMAAGGHVFTVSSNGVWLTDAVPARYLSLHVDEPS